MGLIQASSFWEGAGPHQWPGVKSQFCCYSFFGQLYQLLLKPAFIESLFTSRIYLQDIFNNKNVCSAETFLPLNCSSAQQWEIPRAWVFCVQTPKSTSVGVSGMQWGSGWVPQGHWRMSNWGFHVPGLRHWGLLFLLLPLFCPNTWG